MRLKRARTLMHCNGRCKQVAGRLEMVYILLVSTAGTGSKAVKHCADRRKRIGMDEIP